MVQAVIHRPGSSPGQSTWDLWCTKWQLNRIFSECFIFSPASIIPPTIHVYFHINSTPITGTSGQSTETSSKMFFRASRSTGQRSTFTLMFSLHQGLSRRISSFTWRDMRTANRMPPDSEDTLNTHRGHLGRMYCGKCGSKEGKV